METKKVAFLWGLVTGTFYAFRTLDRDEYAIALGEEIKRAVSRNRGYIDTYASVMAYTLNLEFNWPTDPDPPIPERIKAFERFWELKDTGADAATCFKYFASHVDDMILLGLNSAVEQRKQGLKDWQDAMSEALVPWTPPTEWKLLDELTEAEQADPLSPNAASKSD